MPVYDRRDGQRERLSTRIAVTAATYRRDGRVAYTIVTNGTIPKQRTGWAYKPVVVQGGDYRDAFFVTRVKD